MIISDFQRPSSIVTYNKEGTHSDVLKFSFPERYAESYVAALNHFIDIIEGMTFLYIVKVSAPDYTMGAV